MQLSIQVLAMWRRLEVRPLFRDAQGLAGRMVGRGGWRASSSWPTLIQPSASRFAHSVSGWFGIRDSDYHPHRVASKLLLLANVFDGFPGRLQMFKAVVKAVQEQHQTSKKKFNNWNVRNHFFKTPNLAWFCRYFPPFRKILSQILKA